MELMNENFALVLSVVILVIVSGLFYREKKRLGNYFDHHKHRKH